MGFFDGLKVPVVPAKPPVDQDLVDQIGAEPVKKQRGRLGSAAFDYYRSLGDGRTFVQVAQRFSVTESAVARAAKRGRWRERIHNESPQRAAEISQAVAVRVQQAVPAMLLLSTSEDAEQARRVKNELLQVGMRLVATAEEYLAKAPLTEPQHILKALDIGSRLMLTATESKDAKDGQSLLALMQARLARLQVEPVKDATFTTKPAEPVRGLDDDE